MTRRRRRSRRRSKSSPERPDHRYFPSIPACRAIAFAQDLAEIDAPQYRGPRFSPLLSDIVHIPEFCMESRHHQDLVAKAKGLKPIRTAVVHPVDTVSLLGAIKAAEAGLIVPVLVGPQARIAEVAAQARLDLSPYEMVATEHSHGSAVQAVALARDAQGRGADEGQPAHRRVHERDCCRGKAAHRPAHEPCLRDRRARHIRGRFSSPMPRSSSIPRSRIRSISSRTRSIWPTSRVDASQGRHPLRRGDGVIRR